MKYKAHVRWRRGQCLSTLTAAVLIAMMTNYLFRRYRNSRGPKRREWNPRELQVFWPFSMKIVVFRYYVGIVTTLSIWYGECRYPRRGSPVADRWLKIQKNSQPAVPRRGLEAGFIRIADDFHGSGVNQIDSYLFLQSRNLGSTLAGPFSFFYIKTNAHYKDVRSQRKYYHDQRTNLNLTRMIRFYFLRVSCWENTCRLENYRVCLTTSLYSLLIFFVFLL